MKRVNFFSETQCIRCRSQQASASGDVAPQFARSRQPGCSPCKLSTSLPDPKVQWRYYCTGKFVTLFYLLHCCCIARKKRMEKTLSVNKMSWHEIRSRRPVFSLRQDWDLPKLSWGGDLRFQIYVPDQDILKTLHAANDMCYKVTVSLTSYSLIHVKTEVKSSKVIKICHLFRKFTLCTWNSMTKTIVFTFQY